MRQPSSLRVGITAMAVAIAGLVPAVAGPTDSATAAEPTAVLSTDFEDGSYAPWVASGGPTLSVVDVDGGKALLVDGRTADYDGVASPAGTLTPGQEYTFSMRVRLADGTAGSAGVQFVGVPGYQWIGATTMTADAWTTVSGTWTVPADADATAKVYIGTGDLGAAYSYLVDDMTISTVGGGGGFVPGGAVNPGPVPVSAAQGTGNVAALTFDDGPNPGETEALLDYLAANGITAVFCVIGQNIQAPGGVDVLRRIVAEGHTLCNHTTSYADMGSWAPADIEADLKANLAIIRDALGDPTAQVPYFRAPNGSWGQTPGVAVSLGMQPLAVVNTINDWSTQDVPTLTDNLRAAIKPGEIVLAHDGGGDRSGTIAAVQTVVSERLAAGWSFTQPVASSATPSTVTVASLDFDAQTIDPWTASGSPTLAYVDADGGKALSITRAADYEGIQSPTGIFETGIVYTLSMRARLPEGTAGSADVRFVVKPGYAWVGNATITGDGWTEITGTYTLPSDAVPAESQVYIGSTDQAGPYEILVDDVLITRPGTTGPGTEVSMSFDFENGLQGWVPRADSDGAPTVATTTTEAHGGAQAALISDRTTQGDGIGYDLAGTFEEGVTYDITAWVKMAQGEEPDDLWLSIQTGESTFSTVAQFADVPSGEWREVTASYTFPGGDLAFLYFETSYNTGGPGAFLVDDISIRSAGAPVIQPLTPIKDTVDFPIGVAIDQRETTGSASELLLRHFDQITPENHMKVEAWYDADKVFTPHPQAAVLMDYAAAHDLRLYAHTLVWHSQTPAWFFQNDAGEPLTTSAADQQYLRDRLRTHIFDVAGYLSDEWGLFGSDTNPLVAVDVVNEVISDQATPDGLRTSEWYRILGPEFITLAFQYADEAFNDVYADPATDRPVSLFINDYNTEVPDKADRLHTLVADLLAAGVPVDGVGHQFHTSLSRPVEALGAALTRFEDLPVVQAVTELDVTVGTPVTQANLIEQGYYYRDLFDILRAHAASLFSVTLWGLSDNRSWRSTQAPLAFDSGLQAKQAYYGIVGDPLEPRLRTALVFNGDVPIGPDAAGALDWSLLPLHQVEGVAGFALRWAPDHLTAYVNVTDATDDATDAVSVVVGGSTVTVGRHDAASAAAVVTPSDGGYTVVLRVPLDPAAAEGDTLDANVLVTDGATTTGWSDIGTTGTLTLVEPLSYVGVAAADAAPTIDGSVDAAWADANSVTTDKVVQGAEDGATANVRTLWADDTLYVLAEVTDAQLDATGSDPWIKDSVEIFVDAGNAKNGPYRSEDLQIRVNYLNEVTLDHGDDAATRLQTATAVTDGGYVVEAAIDLAGTGGVGTFHGFDVQVNDATPGADGAPGTRTAVRTWADPTGVGYQSTSRWGVAQLLEPPFVPDPQLSLDTHLVRAGGKLGVELTGYVPGSTVTVQLEQWAFPWFWHKRPVVLTQVTVDDEGAASVRVTVPKRTALGLYTVAAVAGDLRAAEPVLVVPSYWWFPWPGHGYGNWQGLGHGPGPGNGYGPWYGES